jgi:hypothetical protein
VGDLDSRHLRVWIGLAPLSEEHLQSDEYRALSACPGRRVRNRDCVAGRWCRAGRNGPGGRSGSGAVYCACRWRRPATRHDPGKVITDLALTLALGGDCLADVALLGAEPAVFGLVASDPG